MAEHAVALVLALDRKLPRAYSRVRDGNFSLDGLLGFDVHGRTVGIIGTGRDRRHLRAHHARLRLPAARLRSAAEWRVHVAGDEYVELPKLFAEADIISLHAPLTPETRHVIDKDAIRRMKRGVMIINTGRGALVDTQAVIDGLKSGHIGFLGLDVYEEEEELFFEDRSGQIIQDDVFTGC